MKGRIMYVPPLLLEELNSVMKEKNIHKPSYAFEEIAKYARTGRELHNMTPIGLVSKSLRFPKR